MARRELISALLAKPNAIILPEAQLSFISLHLCLPGATSSQELRTSVYFDHNQWPLFSHICDLSNSLLLVSHFIFI